MYLFLCVRTQRNAIPDFRSFRLPGILRQLETVSVVDGLQIKQLK